MKLMITDTNGNKIFKMIRCIIVALLIIAQTMTLIIQFILDKSVKF